MRRDKSSRKRSRFIFVAHRKSKLYSVNWTNNGARWANPQITWTVLSDFISIPTISRRHRRGVELYLNVRWIFNTFFSYPIPFSIVIIAYPRVNPSSPGCTRHRTHSNSVWTTCDFQRWQTGAVQWVRIL